MKTSNKLNKVKGLVAALAVIMITSLGFNAQAQYKSVSGAFKVHGTSNLHNWEMNATSIPAEAQITLKGTEVEDITAFSMTFPVKTLKAKEDLMSSRAYKAMKADKFPTITFKLNNAEVSAGNVKATGVLTIAGTSKTVVLTGKAASGADGTVALAGTYKFKLSDFNIDPPSFMLGALKVGNDLTVDYSVKLKK